MEAVKQDAKGLRLGLSMEFGKRSNGYWPRSGSQSRSCTLDGTERKDVGEVKEEWFYLESACMVS